MHKNYTNNYREIRKQRNSILPLNRAAVEKVISIMQCDEIYFKKIKI